MAVGNLIFEIELEATVTLRSAEAQLKSAEAQVRQSRAGVGLGFQPLGRSDTVPRAADLGAGGCGGRRGRLRRGDRHLLRLLSRAQGSPGDPIESLRFE